MSGSDAMLKALSRKAGATLTATMRAEAWHSAGLSGERIVLEVLLSGPDAPAHAARLVHNIEDHDFTLIDRFVASVTVGPIRLRKGCVNLRLEALILN